MSATVRRRQHLLELHAVADHDEPPRHVRVNRYGAADSAAAKARIHASLACVKRFQDHLFPFRQLAPNAMFSALRSAGSRADMPLTVEPSRRC